MVLIRIFNYIVNKFRGIVSRYKSKKLEKIMKEK